MASEPSSTAGSQFSAQVVAQVFVFKYYRILGISPSLLYNFYHEISIFRQPDHSMSSVTGYEAINEALIALYYSVIGVVVNTIDGQQSLNGAIMVVVTGYHVTIDNFSRNFTRTFILATQERGYFVLNDIFRYVGDDDDQAGNGALPSGDNEPHAPEQGTPQELDGQGSVASEVDVLTEEGVSVFAPPEDEDAPAFEESPDVEVVDEIPISSQAARPDPSSAVLEVVYDTPEDEDTPLEESPPVDVLDEIPSSSQATPPDPSSAVLEDVYNPPEGEDAPPFQESPVVDVLDEIPSSSQAALSDPSPAAVLEDVYARPEDEDAPPFEESPAVDVLDEIPISSQSALPDPGSSAVPEDVYDPPKDEDVPPFEESPKVDVLDEILSGIQSVSPQPSFPSILGEVPMKSYASIVKGMKENPAAPVDSSPVPSSPVVANIASPREKASAASIVRYSIYINNLPPNVTPAQIEEEFKKFGPIKPGGVRIGSRKRQHRSDFGFVKFEVASAVEAVIKASPIKIGGRQVFVEERRSRSPHDNRGGGSGEPSVRGGRGN